MLFVASSAALAGMACGSNVTSKGGEPSAGAGGTDSRAPHGLAGEGATLDSVAGAGDGAGAAAGQEPATTTGGEGGAPGVTSADDPCAASLVVDCSDQCTDAAPACLTNSCAEDYLATLPNPADGEQSFRDEVIVLRTPALRGERSCACASSPENAAAAKLRFRVDASEHVPVGTFSLRVSPPWLLQLTPTTSACVPLVADGVGACLEFPYASAHAFAVFTADPTAPARNITYSPFACPNP